MLKTDKWGYGFSLFFSFSLVFFLTFLLNVLDTNLKSNMDVLSWLYYLLASFGHASLLSFILYLFSYLPFSFLRKGSNIGVYVYTFLSIIVQVILLLDHFVFRLYKFHINGFAIELIFGGAAGDIFVVDALLILKSVGLVFLLAIVPCCLGVYLSGKFLKKISNRLILYICLTASFSILVSHIGYAIAHASKYTHIQKASTGLPLFFPLTANSLLSKWGVITPDDIDRMSYNALSSDLQYPLNPISINLDSIKDYNIVLVAIDSWNPTTFDSITTPNIYSFAKRGHFFSNHLSSNNGTRGSLFGLFFGLSFTYEKEFDISRMSPLIVDRLIDEGYDIDIFPSADFTSPPFHEMIFRRVPNILTRGAGSSSLDRDINITERFIESIETRDTTKRFFSFLFYDLPHAMSLPKEYTSTFEPSWTSPDYLSLNNDIDRTPFFNLYKNCVHYTDKLVGDVLRSLSDNDLLNNTIVIITGDHGQEFNENKKDYWGHGSNYTEWQMKIPLIVYFPDINGGMVYNHTTTHYDVMPTLLSRFKGVQNPSSDYSMGYDLWDDTCNRFPHIVGDHINYGFITSDMILTTGHTGFLEVTDQYLNDLPRSSIDKKVMLDAIELKNKFYKVD